ncbi:hypothetical protein KKA85_11940, partial [bacterium]|nr:hypothetical protein [bacterium]
RYDSPFASARDNGRVMCTYHEFPATAGRPGVKAILRVRPIRQDERSVVDRWDRAGHVALIKPGMAPIEMVKFMTAYGGAIEHEVDVTHLAPLLTGHCGFEVFIDTWVTPAWTVDVDLVFTPGAGTSAPRWATGLFFVDGGLKAELPEVSGSLTIPEGTRRTRLHVMVSGHCTDGRDADEFVTKDNVILVDGVEVFRFRPWRDDCGELRALNPYCARWSDGSWSSDYSRSGWCPGDVVLPVVVDLSAWLAPGEHEVTYRVEDIRPADDEGHHGYWRVSAHLTGWR